MTDLGGSVAIIPARGGSKRIPRKNLREFLGTPMIVRTIECLRASGLFDRVIVSTDDDEIASVSVRHGAEVPFRRPPHLAGDQASTDQVLLHAVQACERVFGAMRLGCCVYAPNPFLTSEDLATGLELLLRHGAPTAFPVVQYDFPIEQAFVLDGDRPRALWPEKLAMRSQDLTPAYHDAGMFYWFDVPAFLRTRELFAAGAVAFRVPPERCQDINTEDDWTRAEVKYRVMLEHTKP